MTDNFFAKIYRDGFSREYSSGFFPTIKTRVYKKTKHMATIEEGKKELHDFAKLHGNPDRLLQWMMRHGDEIFVSALLGEESQQTIAELQAQIDTMEQEILSLEDRIIVP